MKCLYYLAPTLVSTNQISEDLKAVGIAKWNVHIISKDAAGVKKERLNSANWLETHDLLRDGFIGANIGFIFGVLAAGALMLFKPFGDFTPGVAYFFVVVVATLFGAWVGGLIGIDNENHKIRRFHDDIESGKYLLLIYAPKGQGETVKDMMRERHTEARHIATDRQFFNPFARLQRRKAKSTADQSSNKAYD